MRATAMHMARDVHLRSPHGNLTTPHNNVEATPGLAAIDNRAGAAATASGRERTQ